MVRRERPREMTGKEAAGVGSQGVDYKQEGIGAAVWGHTRLGTEGVKKKTCEKCRWRQRGVVVVRGVDGPATS